MGRRFLDGVDLWTASISRRRQLMDRVDFSTASIFVDRDE
jgi:hypothetical protein